MKQSLVFLLSGTALFIGSGHSYAKEKDPEEVYSYLLQLSMEELTDVPILSSGLFSMTWDQTPGLNHIVTKDQFDNFGIRSLGEYLNRMAPAFSTVIHGTQGVTVGTRGIMTDSSAKTLLLRDNINMNNHHFVGINGSELSSPLLGDIDRFEVATGPGALQHGSGAINGYLNMISATGESKEGVRMNTSYGSGDSRLVEGSYGQVINQKANFFLYAGYDKSNGVSPYYTLPPDRWSGLNGVTGTPSETFLDSVRVGRTDDDYKFSFRGQYGHEKDSFQLDLKTLLSHTSNVDPVLGEYLSSSASWVDEVRLAADARGGRYSPFYEQHSDIFQLSPELKFHVNEYHDVKLIPYYQTIKTTSVFSDFLLDEVERLNIALQPKPNPLVANDCPALNCTDDYSYGDELHLGTALIHTYSGVKNQTIAWGAEAKSFEFGNNIWHWTTVGLFAEDQLQVGDFTILPGLRYDMAYFAGTIATVPPFADGPYAAPDDVDALTKRLAVSYKISAQQTAKLSYQEGFRFADSWPQRWGAHINPNLRIAPERSHNYEANYSVLGLLEKRLDLSLAIFHNTYEDTHGWINDQFNFGNSPQQITSVGGDIILEYRPTATWNCGLSYSHARPVGSYETAIRIANSDGTWTRYPDHMVKFHLGHEIVKNLFVGGMGAIESPRYEKAAVSDPGVASLFDRWSLVMDANAWYLIDENIKVSFMAKEFLHKNYNQHPAYFSGTRPLDAPRASNPQYYLSLSYTF